MKEGGEDEEEMKEVTMESCEAAADEKKDVDTSHLKATIKDKESARKYSTKKNFTSIYAGLSPQDDLIFEDRLPTVGPPNLNKRKSSIKQKSKKDGEMTEVEKAKMEEADNNEKVIVDEEKEIIATNQRQGFFTRLIPYSRPCSLVFIGLLVSLIQGCIFPIFGLFLVKMLFALMSPDMEYLREESNFWCLLMFLSAILMFFTMTTQKGSFGIIGENITLKMRYKLYSSIMRKHMGFFDKRENSPGVLTTTLANEA